MFKEMIISGGKNQQAYGNTKEISKSDTGRGRKTFSKALYAMREKAAKIADAKNNGQSCLKLNFGKIA